MEQLAELETEAEAEAEAEGSASASDTDEAVARTVARSERPCAPFNVRTSRRQFQIMIGYMEEHGDLCKLGLTSHKRVYAWDRLRRMLNVAADTDGHSRSIDKWKKVWSDLKNNTKKKALRLAGAAGAGAGCGGGSSLSQIEYRVLKVMNMIKTTIAAPQAEPSLQPTSLKAELKVQPKAILKPKMITIKPDPPPPPSLDSFEITLDALNPTLDKSVDEEMISWPGSPSPKFEKCEVPENRSRVRACALPALRPPDGTSRAAGRLSPAPPAPRPDARGHTTARNVGGRGAGAAGARARRRHELALERERLRLRTDQLELQRHWQRICERGLDLMERLVGQACPLTQVTAAVPPEMKPGAPVPREPATAVSPGKEPGAMQPSRPLVLHPDREQCTAPQSPS